VNNLRSLSIIFFVIVYGYSVLSYNANSYQTNDKLTPCSNTLIRSTLPWDSTCFYRALFDGKALMPDLLYEKHTF